MMKKVQTQTQNAQTQNPMLGAAAIPARVPSSRRMASKPPRMGTLDNR